MRAILFSTGDWPGIAPLNSRYPAPLLPLVDRPFLQHVLEYLVQQKVKRFDLVLSHLPQKIEQLAGDGKRWGCSITFHLARDPFHPYHFLRTIDWEEGVSEPVILGHADRLPAFGLNLIAPCWPTLFGYREAAEGPASPLRWTGWGIMTAKQLETVPPQADQQTLNDHLLGGGAGQPRWEVVDRQLSVETGAEVLRAHRTVLAREFTGLLLTGNEVEPGIWLSRNVLLHPTAILRPPVYIGENCQIGSGVQLGPNAVVQNGCVLDRGSIVANSVILPGSFVGEGLELAEVLVDHHLLINVRLGAAVSLLGPDSPIRAMADDPLLWLLHRLASWFLSLPLLLLASPLLLGTALWLKLFRPGPILFCRQVVSVPVEADRVDWKTFKLWSFCPDEEPGPTGLGAAPTWRHALLRFLPALVNIARGELRFVGVPPRTREEILKLPGAWREIYLRGKAGIVTETAVMCEAEATEEECYAAETFYIATASLWHDLKLLLGYFGRVVFGRPTTSQEPEDEMVESSVSKEA